MKKHPRLARSFLKTNREEILREILKLETFKVCQDTDFSNKFLYDVLLASFNNSVRKSNFSFP